MHRELRDRKVAFFIDKLPEGFWELRYELRAETPGDFHALPLLGYAMYVPRDPDQQRGDKSLGGGLAALGGDRRGRSFSLARSLKPASRKQ